MSILLAQHIKKVLFDSEVSEMVGGRIFLEGLNRDTLFPFIIYEYSITPDGDSNKDADIDDCSLSVSIFAKEGDSSLEIADEVRKALNGSTGTYDKFEVVNTEFSSYSGRLDEDVYVRELSFNVKTY